MLTTFSRAFECIPAVPVNWEALSDLLTQIDQLRDLYKVSWERFASLQEDICPVRAEMQRIRYAVASVQERLDGISNDAVSACEPLIHNLYQQIDTRLSRLEKCSGPSPPSPAQLGDILKRLTRLSERVEQLERAAEADDFHTRIDGYISAYLAYRGLHDHILRQLGTGEAAAPSSISAGSSISHIFRAVHHPPPPSTASVATSVPPPALSSASASTTHEYAPGALSAPAGIRRLQSAINVVGIAANTPAPSAAPPSSRASLAVSGVVPELDPPAHIHTEGGGTVGAVSAPPTGPRLVVSRMHTKTRDVASSTRRRGS